MHFIKTTIYIFSNVYDRLQKFSKGMKIIFWSTTCAAGLGMTLYMMGLIWVRFISTPTFTVLESLHDPTWDMEFPAVTICNTNVVYAPAAAVFKMKLMAYGMNETRIDGFLRSINQLIKPSLIKDTFDDALDVLARMNYTTARMMFELMLPCTKLVHLCNWQGIAMPCERLFRVSTSADGFCCSFNYAAPVEDMDL